MSGPMRVRLGFSLLAAALALVAVPAQAELAWEDIASDAEIMVADGNAVIVATVSATAEGTYGAPPAITLEVAEVLSGAAAKGRTVAVWAPPRCDCDQNTVRDPKGAVARWSVTPTKGPPIASRWILVLDPQRGILTRCRYEYSDEKQKWVVEALARRRAADLEQKKRAVLQQQQAAAAAAQRREAWDRWVAGLPAQVARSLRDAEVVVVGKITWTRSAYPSETKSFRTTFGYEGRRAVKGTLAPNELKYGTAYLPAQFVDHAEGTEIVVFGARQAIRNEALRLEPAKGPLYVVPATAKVLDAINAIVPPPVEAPPPPKADGRVRYNVTPPTPGAASPAPLLVPR